jgi:hypothetical protein
MVYKIQENLRGFGTLRRPVSGRIGRPPKISDEDGEALLEELVRSGWMYQDEMVYWLMVERGVFVSQPTIQRYIKKRQWSSSALRPFSLDRSEELRQGYRDDMARFTAEDLVFLDESIFNEKTGWRHKAYGPIGEYFLASPTQICKQNANKVKGMKLGTHRIFAVAIHGPFCQLIRCSMDTCRVLASKRDTTIAKTSFPG